MDKRELASHFKGVSMNGKGFRARCPAHGSKGQTLSVIRGDRGWIVKCFAGCSFEDVAHAAGLPTSAFMFGGVPSSSPVRESSRPAAERLSRMILSRRYVPTSFGEIVDLELDTTVQNFTRAMVTHPEIPGKDFPDAIRMWTVAMDGFVFTAIGSDWKRYGRNWKEAKEGIAERLWERWRKETKGVII